MTPTCMAMAIKSVSQNSENINKQSISQVSFALMTPIIFDWQLYFDASVLNSDVGRNTSFSKCYILAHSKYIDIHVFIKSMLQIITSLLSYNIMRLNGACQTFL